MRRLILICAAILALTHTSPFNAQELPSMTDQVLGKCADHLPGCTTSAGAGLYVFSAAATPEQIRTTLKMGRVSPATIDDWTPKILKAARSSRTGAIGVGVAASGATLWLEDAYAQSNGAGLSTAQKVLMAAAVGGVAIGLYFALIRKGVLKA